MGDPETFAPITVTQAMLDAKCGLMMQGLDAKGDPVPMEEIYGSTTGFANPAKHYVFAAEGDALTRRAEALRRPVIEPDLRARMGL